jgi:hypothetical protein
MSLQISYWAGQSWDGTPVYRGFISAEARTLSGSSAQSGVTPSGAGVVRIQALSNARVRYGENPTATNDGASLYLASGQHIDLQAEKGFRVAGITAT